MVDPALQELLNEPLGSPQLQYIAEEAHARLTSRGTKPPPEVTAMAKRVSKIHLPAGKRPTSGPIVRERKEAFYEKQIDLEEAVEAAGGRRGSVGRCQARTLRGQRMGDFYEFFGADAEAASKALDIALTTRGEQSMCGIPVHASERYRATLIEAGFAVELLGKDGIPVAA